MMRQRLLKSIERAFVFVLALSAVFAVSRKFPDTMIEPKWLAAVLSAAVWGTFHCACRFWGRRKEENGSVLPVVELAIVVVCGLQATFFLLQEVGFASSYGQFTAGSFGNVAGFASCICLSFPLGWRQAKICRHPWRQLFLLSKAFCVVAVVWSGSRTGMLCLLACSVWKALPVMRKPLLCGMPLLLLLFVFGFKTDSSRGRWFILQRSCELIAQRPLTGWGRGGFEAHYMDVQADYFKSCPDSAYALLADNIRHPLNEWLAVTVDYGLVGLAVVLLLVVTVVRYALRHPSPMSASVLQVWLCLGVFSLFSYPFHYPFTWLTLAWGVAVVFRQLLSRWRKSACLVLLVLLPVVGTLTVCRAKQEMALRQLQDKVSYGQAKRMLPCYAQLYLHRRHDFRFLYSYAFCQYEAGRYPDALRTARECRALLADYDLMLLLGDTFSALGQQDSTLYYYGRAHAMCPSRLTPLYEQFRVYRSAGDTVRCRQLQKAILSKPVKVKSRLAEEMTEEVRSYGEK